MESNHIPFIIIFLCMIGISVSRTTIFEWTRNHVIDNLTSTDGRIRTITTHSKVKCSRECLDTTGCAGFFYSRQSGLCNIHSGVSFGGVSMTNSPQTSFYSNVCMKFKYTYDAELRKYYMRHVTPTHTLTGAEIACENSGGRLISLSDEHEFQDMQQILRNVTQINVSDEAFWVGAQVNTTSGHFHWNDGVTVKQGFWEPGQPEYKPTLGKNLTECVLLMPIFDYRLDDYQCTASSSLKIYPLCECDLQFL